MMSLNNTHLISPTITVAISTIAENIGNFIKNFYFDSLNDADQVVIIIQGDLDNRPSALFDNNYTIVEDDGKGVSRSRNIGLLHASCDYIWFMDDDILLNSDAIAHVKNNISKYGADIFTVRMKNIEMDKPYKNYPKKHRLDRRDIINISSVEIITSRRVMVQSKVRFNELIGLGTTYPSCEENILLLDLFDFGAEIIHIPIYVQKHPFVNRKEQFINPNILFAKGIFGKRYSGFMGILIISFWFIRSLIYGANYKDCFNLIYGYHSAGKYLN